MAHKKKVSEMTTDELAKRIFPKDAKKELQRVAHEKEQAKKKAKK
ncbi:MAG: hypothetical protein NPIRA01_05090 [Nitrospirales bacterium]|nr:MAG: hypothetical protein NPIRA01_05090 [Nitrospirales bacterium]